MWQQFYDLQHGKRAEDEDEINEYDKISDEDIGEEGAEWYEDTEIDKGDYENIIYIDGDQIEEIEESNSNFKRFKGS